MDIDYRVKYEQMKGMYLSGNYSLTQIGKIFHCDRGALSKRLKQDGVNVVNRQNVHRVDECFFDIIDTEEKAYWLGFLCADGAISSDRNTIELSLASKDIAHVMKFQKAVGYTGTHLFCDDVRCRFAFGSKHMKDSLLSAGCTPRKSLTLKFPSLDVVPEYMVRHYVRGYIDGDGSVMIGKNHRGERVVPRLSILGTYEFLDTLISRMSWSRAKICHPSGCYSVEWGGKYVIHYLDSIYGNCSIYLDRKYAKYLELKRIADDKSGKKSGKLKPKRSC